MRRALFFPDRKRGATKRLHAFELENETTGRQEQSRAESNKDYMTTDNGLYGSGASRAILLVCGDVVLVGRWNIVDGLVRYAAFF